MKNEKFLKIISVIGAFLVGFWIPLRLIDYIVDSRLEIFFDLVISLVSGINVYLYFSKPNHPVRKLSSWLNVWLILDLLCLLPLSLISLVFYGATTSWILIFNLIAARHIRHIKGFLDYFDQLQSATYRLVPILLMLPLVVHTISCGWIALGSGTIGPTDDKALEYTRAVYWAFTTLTTVGYGDISAKTIGQMIYTCAVQFTGVGFFGFIISNMASFLSRRDAAREHHMDNLDKIETFMRTHHIPLETRQKIRSYYHYLWVHKKGYQDKTIVKSLPRKIQSELFLHINKPVLEKVPFLRDAQPELVEDLMHELDSLVCVPGEKIFRAGDEGGAMYFIYKGKVEIVGDNDKLIATLHEGDFFGEMALLDDRRRTASARASRFCELYSLNKAAFNRVCVNYPEFLSHIEKVKHTRK